jgi:tRNA modification GTPase
LGADTIFAKASGAGRAGVSVVRLSGPLAFEIAEKLAGRLPAPNRAALRPFRDGAGDLIDRGLVILFKGPASFTGEDVAEFHPHGGPAVEAALFATLLAHGARLAEAGEFTKRALLNGKLDLAEVEGLADLLDAETAEQRKQALGQFGGRLSAVAEDWRGRLVSILAPLEAAIDFPDEADVPAAIAARAGPEIDALLGELRRFLTTASAAKAIREGVKIAIIGAPNAGKSSLLNRLAGSERAIVSDAPGTTRDVVEARLDLGGILVSLSDTAGLREETSDFIESEGMRRTRMNALDADVRLLTIDASEGSFRDGGVSRETNAPGAPPEIAENAAYGLLRDGDFLVFNKIDLAGRAGFSPPFAGRAGFSPPCADSGGLKPALRLCAVSARTGEGIDALVAALTETAARLCGRAEDAGLTRVRHVAAVEAAIGHLTRAGARLGAPELAAEDVRLAARELGRITGAVGVEDVLGAIFSSFCIGK